MSTISTPSQRPLKPPPVGPAPQAPPPSASSATHAHTPVSAGSVTSTSKAPTLNGTTTKAGKKGKPAETPVDPQAMYESLKTKIAALEEELNHADEEELRFASETLFALRSQFQAEEAQKSVRGLEENAVHSKYIELFAEMKRLERDHAKEKQKLTKDRDTAKTQMTKVTQTKTKLENAARELQKDNKKLRDEKQQLLQDVAKGLEEQIKQIKQLSTEITKGKEKARQHEIKNREQPDIVVKVVCKYRAELFFKISRKTKLSRLFIAWAERMEAQTIKKPQVNGTPPGNNTSTLAKGSKDVQNEPPAAPAPPSTSNPSMNFMYTHQGRVLRPELSIEEAGIEDADEILAVEMMDLTGPVPDDAEHVTEQELPKLKKNWIDDPREAKRAMEEIFDSVTKERLKLILRQYELRERHFECFIRSKELELVLGRYRESEQRQLVEFERNRIDKLEEDNQQVRKELEDVHNGQTLLIEKLIQCCKEPNAERTQRLFMSLRDELEKRGTKLVDAVAVG